MNFVRLSDLFRVINGDLNSGVLKVCTTRKSIYSSSCDEFVLIISILRY